jgi:hypothetical protein
VACAHDITTILIPPRAQGIHEDEPKKISSSSQNPKIRYTEETAQALAITGFEPILLPNLRFQTTKFVSKK